MDEKKRREEGKRREKRRMSWLKQVETTAEMKRGGEKRGRGGKRQEKRGSNERRVGGRDEAKRGEREKFHAYQESEDSPHRPC